MSACGNPNVEPGSIMLKKPKFDGNTKICVKCKTTRGNIVVRYAVYCKSCFFPLVQMRFRKTLEPMINPVRDGPRRKALKAAGGLLVGYSGGTASTTLLDIVAKTYFTPRDFDEDEAAKAKGGTNHPRNQDDGIWKGRPTVCYVEVRGAFPNERDKTAEIEQVVASYEGAPFDFIPLRLEDAFDPSWWTKVNGDPSAMRHYGLDLTDEGLPLHYKEKTISPRDALNQYLSSLPTQTARHSSVQTLIRVLLLHTAASLQSSHILLGTTLTALSINLISGIAQGSGFSVVDEAMEEWSPRAGEAAVRIIRPLRDVGLKECAIWDWWCGLRLVVGPIRPPNERDSIASLTRDFVTGLETDYPATVSTIARTCAKLSAREGNHGKCILCERPAQEGVQEWKASISIRAYHDAGAAVLGDKRPPHLTENEIENLASEATEVRDARELLASRLCYACLTTLTSQSSRGTKVLLGKGETATDVPVPVWVNSQLGTKLDRKAMKAQIAEYILPEQET